jgi:hypothetical protein
MGLSRLLMIVKRNISNSLSFHVVFRIDRPNMLRDEHRRDTMNVMLAVRELRNEKQRIQGEIFRVRAALEFLTGEKPRSGRRLDAASRAKIAKARRERWKRIKANKQA